ncbi:MAG: cupin domain-containing protein [Novosphingobium sp.]|uniref:cupin domain-containing protein n=1 Tax=Novosphingobium sp. TaxID=1874826 RepID=UPI003B9D183A
MARPHIEFVHAQNVGWTPRADGAEEKVLNADPLSDEATLIVRYPPGYSAPASSPDHGAEEFFVLDGAIDIDGEKRRAHAYGFLPQGSGLGVRHTAQGAVLLVFRHAAGDPNALDGTAQTITLHTPAMPWDVSTYDPKLIHLRLARKVLRLGPNNSGRTFLLTGMAHGVPAEATTLPAEMHDHAEEMFMLQGAMWAPEGRMGAGAYFYRPPGILHGPHVSEYGFLQIMRSPGANAIVTHWSDVHRPLPINAPYCPVLPHGTPPEWAWKLTPQTAW